MIKSVVVSMLLSCGLAGPRGLPAYIPSSQETP